MFRLEFNTDNAVFEDNPEELAEILDSVAGAILAGDSEGIVKDSRGEAVGEWRYVRETFYA